MEMVWVVASGKGGTGKTTLVANLGVALAKEGYRVLLVDLDLGLRCLDLCLGMDDRVLFDVMDVLDGVCRPEDAILQHPTIETLFLLPAAQNRSPEDFDGQRLKTLCSCLIHEYEMILLDCPPGLDPIPAQAALSACRGLVVITPDPASLRDADRMAGEMFAAGVPETYLVINRFRTDFMQKQFIPTAQEIAATLGLPLLGTVPADDAVEAATLCGEPVVIHQPDSPAARILIAMAGRLPGKELV